MGPQLVRCGMHERGRHQHQGAGASMGPQLVRCGMKSQYLVNVPKITCFNGAATCSLWNALFLFFLPLYLYTLQWGRNLFVAECKTSAKDMILGTWLQWGRNLFVAECRSAVHTRPRRAGCFNGAATCSLRNASAARPPRPTSTCFNGAATCSLRNAARAW